MSALRFAPPAVSVERLSGGRLLLRSAQSLAPHARSVGEVLLRWAAAAPERVFLAESNDAGELRQISYAQAAAAARALGQALLDRGLGPSRPLAILSDNAIDHALLALGAMHAGIPVAPISPAYSLLSRDHEKLRAIVALIRPGLVYAADGETFARALDAAVPTTTALAVSARPPAGRTASLFADLLATAPGPAIDSAFAGVGPDTIAKLLFTSGSTGEPKGVLNTQRMLCSNQQAISQLWPFLDERPPVVVDWLPWSHTFGGNHNFYMVLWHGGTLHVDRGKPSPALIGRSIATLKAVSPTLYFNVPRGFDMLLPHLERDAALRDSFFARLDLLFYAAAALPQPLWDRLEQVSILARGERVPMVSAWGATETSPMVTSVHFAIDRPGVIGLPAPGTEVLMVPSAGKWELRVRGPNVTPGYFERPDLTADAFDEDGFYRIGDAGKLADPEDPAKGLVFDGRIAEDFKLTSGTWVHVGALRLQVIAACAPVVEDAVITGHDRDDVGVLLFPSLDGCRRACANAAADVPMNELIQRAEVRDRVREGLVSMAGGGGIFDACGDCASGERASVDRRGRDHRQGLCEPARGAPATRCRGRSIARGRARRRGDSRPRGDAATGGPKVIADPPERSYLEGILVAIRGAGQRMVALGGYLGSAEQATNPVWKWQLLTAAGRAYSDALAGLDEADERLQRLGSADELPAPLDQLPLRLRAMRADLRAAHDRIQKAIDAAASSHVGNA